jgi:uncharacterized membrane protein
VSDFITYKLFVGLGIAVLAFFAGLFGWYEKKPPKDSDKTH